jgi:hypothetical protein
VKAYVLTTGLVFVLILAAHIARLFGEGYHLLKQPLFLATSLLSLGIALWALCLFRRWPRESAKSKSENRAC